MKLKLNPTIEKKILIPFVLISIISVVAFCLILYRTEHDLKLEDEVTAGTELIGFLYDDLSGKNEAEAEAVLEKYRRDYTRPNLFILRGNGETVFSLREMSSDEQILAEKDVPEIGWRLVYSVDRDTLNENIIEEQRYMILAAIALLLIIVQVSVLIAYNISSPIRELGDFCSRISEAPQTGVTVPVEYTRRQDEVGQLAAAFQTMLQSTRSYQDELGWMKALNEGIVENLPLGILVYDSYRNILFQNTRAYELLALTDCDRDGLTLKDHLHAMVEKEAILPGSVTLLDRKQKQSFFEFGSWRLTDESGTILGTIYTIDDVSYRQLMEEKVIRNEKLAYTGEIAAEVAHEARNPLAGIRAGIQLMQKKLEDPDDKALCGEMIREVDRVNLQINNLVNISRRHESEMITVDLNSMFEELEMLYAKIAANQGIRLKADGEEGLKVFSDEQELRQILVNLINNSIRAMKEGGLLQLIGRRTEKGVIIQVKDNGKGMDAVTLQQVREGSIGGYGLSIVRRLSRQNGATVEIDAEEGLGTSITLTFRGLGEA